MSSFKVEVSTSGPEGMFASNQLRFSSVERAKAYGSDLAGRWTAVTTWRVVASDDPVKEGRFADDHTPA